MKIELPGQLQNSEFRFIKVEGKEPYKKQHWREENYTYTDAIFKKWLKVAGGYGFITGKGNTIVLDIDCKELAQVLLESLPKTFTVQTGGGGYHFYYTVNHVPKKLVLHDYTGRFFTYDKNGEKSTHVGELQCDGQYVVGPGSAHETGNTYDIINDDEIANVKIEEILDWIGQFSEDRACHSEGSDIDIEPLVRELDLEEHNNTLIGSHPIHGSTNGKNFNINLDKNYWYCFRCDAGGDAISLAGILGGIITCEDCKKALSKKQYKACCKIARERYGITTHPKLTEEFKEPDNRITPEHVEALKDPLLMTKLVKEVQAEGVVGNEANIAALILRLTMRLVCDAQPISKNLIVTAKSGGGKDCLVKATTKVMLNKFYYKHLTKITPQAFTYYHTSQKDIDAGWTWDKKVLYMEDPPEDIVNHPVTKTMASGGKEQLVVREQATQELKIEGQPVMIITSYENALKEEGIRRWDSLPVDTSKEVTKAVTEKVLQRRGTKYKKNIDYLLREAVQNLPLKCVTLNYIPDLVKLFDNNLAIRSKVQTFTDLICASTVLHQYQREIDKDGNIIADWNDIAWAAWAFKHCSGYEGKPISDLDRDLLALIPRKKNLAKTIAELSTEFYRDSKWIWRSVGRLKSLGLVKETRITGWNGVGRPPQGFYQPEKCQKVKGWKKVFTSRKESFFHFSSNVRAINANAMTPIEVNFPLSFPEKRKKGKKYPLQQEVAH